MADKLSAVFFVLLVLSLKCQVPCLGVHPMGMEPMQILTGAIRSDPCKCVYLHTDDRTLYLCSAAWVAINNLAQQNSPHVKSECRGPYQRVRCKPNWWIFDRLCTTDVTVDRGTPQERRMTVNLPYCYIANPA